MNKRDQRNRSLVIAEPGADPAPPLAENELWLLSYYRSSEINGALFFGRVARTVRGPLQVDVTHHFSDEANHARYWTACIDNLGRTAIKQNRSYQDQYLESANITGTCASPAPIRRSGRRSGGSCSTSGGT